MKSIVALEELIKENEQRIALQRRMLGDHESGANRLSRMVKASTESHLEEETTLVVKYKAMLEELLSQDQAELEEKERLEEAIRRKKYFDNQKNRINASREVPSDQKLEAMMILDELDRKICFEDDELLDVAIKSLELNLSSHEFLKDQLNNIKTDFTTSLSSAKNEQINSLGMLDVQVPILILHFNTLVSNIQQTIDEMRIAEEEKRKEEEEERKRKLAQQKAEEEAKKNPKTEENKEEEIQDMKEAKEELDEIPEIAEAENAEEEKEKENFLEKKFQGLPKFEDWWIEELWSSHQAYFALFKWKAIIENLCITQEQKRAWSKIFDNWVFVKKLLNNKGDLAFEYTLAFDTLISRYAGLEEETAQKNLVAMEDIVLRITKKEDFSRVMRGHEIETPYLKFKRSRTN